MTPAEIQSTLATLDQTLKAINDNVNNVLNNALFKVLPAIPQVVQWIHDRVADVSHTIEAIVNSVITTVGGAIGAIVPTAVDFLLGVVNNVFNDVHNILSNLATAEDFVAGAIGEISKHAGGISNVLLGAIGSGISGGIVDVLKFLEVQDENTINHFLDEILKAKSLPNWLHSMVSGLRGRGAEWQALALPLLVGVLLQPIGEAMINPMLIELKQESNSIFKTQVASPPELIEMHLKGVLAYPDFLDGMARNNFNKDRADQMMQARYERLTSQEINILRFRNGISPIDATQESQMAGVDQSRLDWRMDALRPILDEDAIRQTFLRGIIDRPKHDQLMAMHGYTQDAIDRKVNLYYLIPGPQDLIHMGIRNVFDPQIVERFQLAQDAPADFFKAAAMQGISQDWALKFWEAHWIVPGIDEAFRMYQRTIDHSSDTHADSFTLIDGTNVQNVIGRSTLELFLKDKDVPPYYRDKMTEIAYHPLNRIDIRRMRIVGSLTQAQVQRAYLDLGYNLKNATLLADFVEKLAKGAKKDAAQPYVDGLRRRILQYYVEEKLELSDASFALTDLGFTEQEATAYLTEASLIQQAEDAVQMEVGIGRIFVAGYITEDDARKRLGAIAAPAKAIDRLIRKWNLQRELRLDTEHFHKMRDLSKAEITEAYTDKLMTRGDAETFLGQLGYPQDEATIVLSLADYKAARTTRTATQEAIKAAYVNGVLDLVPASNKLDALGLPTERRDSLLTEWTLLRETRTEKIPLATLRDLVKSQRFSRDEAFVHLKRHRYTDADANVMLDLWQGL